MLHAIKNNVIGIVHLSRWWQRIWEFCPRFRAVSLMGYEAYPCMAVFHASCAHKCVVGAKSFFRALRCCLFSSLRALLSASATSTHFLMIPLQPSLLPATVSHCSTLMCAVFISRLHTSLKLESVCRWVLRRWLALRTGHPSVYVHQACGEYDLAILSIIGIRGTVCP